MYTYRDDRDAESCSMDLRKHVIIYILHFKGRCIGCELLNSHMQELFEVDISEDLFKAKKTNIFGSGFNMKMTLCSIAHVFPRNCEKDYLLDKNTFHH